MDQIESIGSCSNIQKAAVIFFIRLVDCNITFSVIILCSNIAFIAPDFSNFPARCFIIPSIFTEAEGGVQPVSGQGNPGYPSEFKKFRRGHGNQWNFKK